MTDAAAIVVDRSNSAVAVVTIDRPDQRNAMTLAMWRALGDAFAALSAAPDIRAVILTGAGGAFCAGADIKEFSVVRGDAAAAAHYGAVVERANNSILDCPKTTIAAISGPAMGGGCGLALCCDFRVGDGSAYLGIPAARLGLVYGVAETRSLVEAVGVEHARTALFSARRYPAEDAVKIGLLTEISGEDALTAARALAETFGASAPLSIAGAKRVIRALRAEPSPSDRDAIGAVVAAAAESVDHKEGVAAFRERRAAIFKGV